MSTTPKKVSVVVICRNEERFIGRCLDSLLGQTYPRERLEVLVVNGASEDQTREVVASYVARYPGTVKLLENPRKFTPISMNIGIASSTGDYIAIAGAHSTYASDYLERCATYLERYGADNVGGAIRTVPAADTTVARAIAAVLRSPFGTGNSYFRTGSDEPRFVDTVFGGFFRRDVFERVGRFNEALTRSQDMEFNLRLARAGGKILLAPDITSDYYPRATLGAFLKHNVADGVWAILPMKFGAARFKTRHLIPLLFVASIVVSTLSSLTFPPLLYVALGVLALYAATSIYFAMKIAAAEKDLALVPSLIAAFAARHFGYGVGSLVGLTRLFI